MTDYAEFVAARLAAGDAPNTINASINNALGDALNPTGDWRWNGRWVRVVEYVCPVDQQAYYCAICSYSRSSAAEEMILTGKCPNPRHIAPLVLRKEWDAQQRALPVVTAEGKVS